MALNQNSLAKNFEFPRMVSDWNTYNSSRDKTNVAENVWVRGSKNMYKKLSGTMANRPGQKRLGVANSTASAIYSYFVWNTSWGATFVMAVSDSKLYVILNEVWYQLQGSLTSSRYVFDKWWDNTLKKDVCLFVNGSDDTFMWTGGFAFISSTTANTIVLDRTVANSFLTTASGSVVVNGTTYAYTGTSGSTLTGVTPDPTGEANGSAVFQAVTTTSNSPASGFANDFIKVVNNQVYFGSYTSRLCYVSANDDYTDFTVPTPRLAGSPELLTLDGTLNGISVRQGNAYISFGTDSWAAIIFNDITVGTTLAQSTKVDIKPVAVNQAAYSHEMISSVGDNIVYLAKDQQVRVVGDFNNAFTPRYPSFSQALATELEEEDFTGGYLTCVGEFIYLCSPQSGNVYLRQERTTVDNNGNSVLEILWHAPFIWNLTAVDSIDGVVVGFSNANPQIYQLWGTGQWHDDSPSDEPLPYSCILALSYRGETRRQGLWSFDKNYTEGYCTEGTTLSLRMNYNYQGSTDNSTAIINSVDMPATFFIGGGSASSLGDESLGEEELGDGFTSFVDEQDTLPKFKVINSLALTNCFEWQPIFYTDQVDARWEILATATNAVEEPDQQSTFLINKRQF